ncbi:MAG TPA: FAD-dependent oxidoreductase [bacterium]|nr:FAD-dependent oxidoreductase [bacterium]
MKLYRTILSERIHRTSTIESFRLVPEERISFIPGQFVRVFLDRSNPGNRELNKYLSFSSAPGREYVEVSKRLTESVFSGRLRSLRKGDEVWLSGSMGNCFPDGRQEKIAFLAGGIGITPVISILEHFSDMKLKKDVVLLYSNRLEDDIAFKPEIDRWRRENPRMKVFYILTGCQPRDPDCFYGYIDEKFLSGKIPDAGERTVFIFGPPAMVKAMSDACHMKVPGENIKTERFAGY